MSQYFLNTLMSRKVRIFFSERPRFRREQNVCGDFVNLRHVRLSVSWTLYLGSIHRVMCVYVNLYLYIVFRKKKSTLIRILYTTVWLVCRNSIEDHVIIKRIISVATLSSGCI
jgi:hypothetical protein